MDLTEESLADCWKEIIRNKTLKPVGVGPKPSDYRIYMQYFKGRAQIVVKKGSEFYNFNLVDATEETQKYQSEKNIIE